MPITQAWSPGDQQVASTTRESAEPALAPKADILVRLTPVMSTAAEQFACGR
ncbi:hypothetical protein [Mycolicibacterium llatzerense]|uniref:hypothetical protein n=1 Tax=Mycolicibacterium llatzerense TaxID=280871 RepID=UPI0021B6B78A|nr:hypothetical protein [Mycolicibacterium llatzerense]